MTTAFKYTILSGNTFFAIATQINNCVGVSYSAIEAANPQFPASNLQIGQVIQIPTKSGSGEGLHYTIRSGDSYSKIASEIAICAGITQNDIAAANPTISPTSLQIGEVIAIPETSVSPSPSATKVPAQYMAQWLWTYSSGGALPGGNIACAFSGWADVNSALTDSAKVLSKLQGTKFITIGGGNPKTGSFTASVLSNLNNAISAGKLSDYDGVAYDVEEGDAGLETAFANSFSIAQKAGLKVLVTVSHSAPYGISDAQTLMASFFGNSDIDFLSPQLYTTGKETANQYATSGGVGWDQFANAKAAIIPSIVAANYYNDSTTTGRDAVAYFKTFGVDLAGYVQWSQVY